MGILEAMLQRNALHALLPLLDPETGAEVQAEIARLDVAIAQAQAQEVLL